MLKENIKTAQHDFAVLMTGAEKIRQKYQGEKSEMTGQEDAEYCRMVDEALTLQGRIETMQKEVKLQEFVSKPANEFKHGGGGSGGCDTAENESQRLALKSFGRYIMGGINKITQEDLKAIGAGTSVKAYQADDSAAGGFLISPQKFVEDLIMLVKDLVFMRQLGTNFDLVRAESLGFPALDVDPSDSDWTTELGTGSEELTAQFGKRELRPHPVAKRVKISNKLLRNAVVNPEKVLQERLAYKMGVTEEKAFLVGDGSDKPLGVFTPSAAGVPTSRDIIAASATAIGGDDILNLYYSLKAQYQGKATFMFHRLVLLAVRKLKDTTNNYIWATGFGPGQGYQGQPATLLGRPYVVSEYAPSALTTGLYTMVVGDFSKYYIATALDMQLQVLDQLYAETNQMGYILRAEVDGMPVLAEAFARLKLA